VGDGVSVGVGMVVGVGTAGVSDAAGAGLIVSSGLCAAEGTGVTSPLISFAKEAEGNEHTMMTAAKSAVNLI
jgi:hypothetical protein